MSHDIHWIVIAFACFGVGKLIARLICRKEVRR
jgi:hypothetical protein